MTVAYSNHKPCPGQKKLKEKDLNVFGGGAFVVTLLSTNSKPGCS